MDIGMLWRDDAPEQTLEARVARAAAHYRQTYGEAPTVCFVHPTLLSDEITYAAGLRLLPVRTVPVDHFWLGVNFVQPARQEAVSA